MNDMLTATTYLIRDWVNVFVMLQIILEGPNFFLTNVTDYFTGYREIN